MQTPRTARLSPNAFTPTTEIMNSNPKTSQPPLSIGNPRPALSLPAPSTSRLSKGFTLTELLIVIGIIAVLMGILLPVIKKMRYAAYAADTQNEISQISNACTSYYTSFHAYPGPFTNDETAGGTVATMTALGGNGPARLAYWYGSVGGVATYSQLAPRDYPWTVTGAQNLVLGLMGGLKYDTQHSTANNAVLAFAPSEVGLGPMNLNPINPSRTPSFFSTGSNYLMWCQYNSASVGTGPITQTTGAYPTSAGNTSPPNLAAFTDAANTQVVNSDNCPIPVFVDRYPTPGPLPILYLRARAGVKGVVWDNTTPTITTPAYYQYDLRDIAPYTTSHIGLASTDSAGNPSTHNLTSIYNAATYTTKFTPLTHDNGLAYFMNSSIPPTSNGTVQAADDTGRPRAVDQFILISAGPDGIYGTADDITSFGDVSQ